VIIQQDSNSATYQIQRYEPGKIWVNQRCYENSVVICPHQFIEHWPPKELNELQPVHLEAIIALKPEIVLLGTGPKALIPAQELLVVLFEKGIGVEFMDTKAACFTYMVLAAEERNICACLFL
jgi:uncharacterized protein